MNTNNTFRQLCALSVVVINSGCSQVVKDEKPNFIILLTDDQRMDAMGAYNAELPIKTPYLDLLANEGIRFTNGFVTTPICVVSRASILTGRYACNARLHQFNTPLPPDVFAHSYPVYLKNTGYFTGQLGKYGVGIEPEEMKYYDVFDGQSTQGPAFREYMGRMMHDSEWLTIRAGEFLDQVPNDTPFCLQLNYKAPHPSSAPAPEDEGTLSEHYFVRNPMDRHEEYEKLPVFVQNGFGRHCYQVLLKTGNEHNPYLRDYYEKIISVDRSLGNILRMLEEKGMADNTVIIFLSDHGTHFGEKQLAGKWTPYEQSLRIPFVIYDPRPKARKGIVLDEMVLNIDVAPTLLDLAGIPIPEVMDGKSMAPLMYTKNAKWRDHFFYEHFTAPATVKRYIPRNEGVRTKTTKYVRWIDIEPTVEEFYDLTQDPMESENLIDNPEYHQMVVHARQTFEQWRRENPSNYHYDSYGRRPQSGAKEIDWNRFKEVRPIEYEKIKTEVERLEVTWTQAIDDWDIRYKICSKVGYWY